MNALNFSTTLNYLASLFGLSKVIDTGNLSIKHLFVIFYTISFSFSSISQRYFLTLMQLCIKLKCFAYVVITLRFFQFQ